MLFIEQNVSNDLPLPFFIEWDEPFEERMKSLRDDGTITLVNEKLIISSCEFVANNPEKRIEEWGNLLNITPLKNSIKLPNTNLLFINRTNKRERLVNVHITENK